MRPAPAIVGRMRVFVFDDACGPCTRAAAFLRRRAGAGAVGTDAAGASDGAGAVGDGAGAVAVGDGAGAGLIVLPFSRVREELDDAARERFAREALYAQGPTPSAAPPTETLPTCSLPVDDSPGDRPAAAVRAMPAGWELRGRAAWGHAAIARALLASPHRVDRLAGRVILARPVAPAARRVYGWVARHRRVLNPLFPPAG